MSDCDRKLNDVLVSKFAIRTGWNFVVFSSRAVGADFICIDYLFSILLNRHS